jgi:hypothetical protein
MSAGAAAPGVSAMWAGWLLVAWAQDAGVANDLPLAIPVDAPQAATVEAPQAEPVVEPAPELPAPAAWWTPPDPAEIPSFQEYARRELSVVPVPETVGVWAGLWGALPSEMRLQGRLAGSGLDAPALLDALGDTAGASALRQRVRSQRTVAGVLLGLAVAGGGAVIASEVSKRNTNDPVAQNNWQLVAIGGWAGLVGGLAGSSIPSRQAARLVAHPDLTVPASELEQRVVDHNASIADMLGLDPGRAWGFTHPDAASDARAQAGSRALGDPVSPQLGDPNAAPVPPNDPAAPSLIDPAVPPGATPEAVAPTPPPP